MIRSISPTSPYNRAYGNNQGNPGTVYNTRPQQPAYPSYWQQMNRQTRFKPPQMIKPTMPSYLPQFNIGY